MSACFSLLRDLGVEELGRQPEATYEGCGCGKQNQSVCCGLKGISFRLGLYCADQVMSLLRCGALGISVLEK